MLKDDVETQTMSLKVTGLKISDTARARMVAQPPDFELRDGEVVGLCGPIGAGKTLTALAIAGLLPASLAVSSGSIELDGNELTTSGETDWQSVRGDKVSIVHQSPAEALDPIRKCRAQLEAALAWSRTEFHEGILDRVLTDFEIDDPRRVLNSFPHQISGGERQRVIFAMHALRKPKYLIADEPTSGLNRELFPVLVRSIEVLKQNTGCLVISHDDAFLRQVSDRIVRFESDTTALVRPPAQQKETKSSLDETIIRLKNVAIVHDQTNILSNVSLSIGKSEILGLRGASGTGKTSLARVIAGLDKPRSGTVEMMTQREPRNKTSPVQIIYQDPRRSLTPSMRVLQAVEEAAKMAGAAAPHTAATEALNQLGFPPDKHNRYPRELSGGQCQLIALARALVTNPELLIADEVTASLDVESAQVVLEAISRIAKDSEIGVLMISHDQELLRAYAHQMLQIKDCRILVAER